MPEFDRLNGRGIMPRAGLDPLRMKSGLITGKMARRHAAFEGRHAIMLTDLLSAIHEL
jgi:hypothetical protein